MLAEFSVVPLDKGATGLSQYVAKSLEIIESSGLDYEIHALGTLVEGPPEAVWAVIRTCHEHMAAVSDRVVTTIKIDDRKGATGRIKGKVRAVEEKIGHELSKG